MDLIADAVGWLVPGRVGRVLRLIVGWSMFLAFVYVLYSNNIRRWLG